MQLLSNLASFWRHAIEIIILWICIYQIYRAFKSTRGARILVGLVLVLVVLTLLSSVLELKVIEWIITRAAALLAVALLIIFQPELRNALARLGSSKFFSFSNTQRIEFLDTFSLAVTQLANAREGALFAFERGISLKEHQETGVEIDAVFTPELAKTVFFPKTPLHDGGMIIAENRVAAAGCVFPVSNKELADRSTGLRHRAAIGITEESDAVAVVVSEETGMLSICIDGRLERNLSHEDFRNRMEQIFLPEENTDDDEEDSDTQLARETGSTSSSSDSLVSD
ncbi:diadenylate cyclase CdaA [Persicirhabdus sediminis]|uniref:Diadenylate cyclase n=1 Tax=Persicirhabdus sediminis TaxID=454144 RepID=A0A8J7MBR3_9BACT|nr:diadenylate cyclase CdaA [Persicirhabdus sediminis]MBK1790532.1 TIGR00159 family protein [Persicirhabdus sediminis]